MVQATTSRGDRDWKLYSRALDILERRSAGHALPILRKLALRGFAPAADVLSDFLRPVDAVRLLRRAARRGDPVSAYNLAVAHRNRGDMLGYRYALARAAKLDSDAALEFGRFKTRFPHEAMRRFGRLEPDRLSTARFG